MSVKVLSKYAVLFLLTIAAITVCWFSVAAQAPESFPAHGFSEIVSWTPDSENVVIAGQNGFRRAPLPSLNPQLGFFVFQENQVFGGYCGGTNTAAVLEDHQRLLLYDAETAVLKGTIPFDFFAQSSACSPDGRTLLISSADDLAGTLLDSETGERLKTLSGYSTAAPVYSVAFSQNGENLLWHSRGTFQLQNIADETLSEAIQLWDFVSVYALSGDSKTLAVFIPDENAAQYIVGFFETVSGTELGRIAVGDQLIHSIVFDPSSTFVVLAAERTLTRVSLADFGMSEVEIFSAATEPDEEESPSIQSIQFSPDGAFLAVLKSDGTVTLLDLSVIE